MYVQENKSSLYAAELLMIYWVWNHRFYHFLQLTSIYWWFPGTYTMLFVENYSDAYEIVKIV